MARSDIGTQCLLDEESLTTPKANNRSPRRRILQSPSKRWLWIFPVILLCIFGLLHLLQVIIGRARLGWDIDHINQFLPAWVTDRHGAADPYSEPVNLTKDVLPIPCHSHNDYWRPVPLYDALHWGMTSVEADVWLSNNELYVGHNSAAMKSSNTFRGMYVEPLVLLLDQMNSGFNATNNTSPAGVFHTDPTQTLTLLIDFKTDGADTWPVVVEQLGALREQGYLTFYDGKNINQRPITAVGTGNAPFDLIKDNATYRDVFFDAPLKELWQAPSDTENAPPTYIDDVGEDANSTAASDSTVAPFPSSTADQYNVSNSYYASVNFKSVVGIVWSGKLSSKQLRAIRGQIQGAKRRGLKARYWNTPAWPVAVRNNIWRVLMEEGADVLNVDDLRAAAAENWKARIHAWW